MGKARKRISDLPQLELLSNRRSSLSRGRMRRAYQGSTPLHQSVYNEAPHISGEGQFQIAHFARGSLLSGTHARCTKNTSHFSSTEMQKIYDSTGKEQRREAPRLGEEKIRHF